MTSELWNIPEHPQWPKRTLVRALGKLRSIACGLINCLYSCLEGIRSKGLVLLYLEYSLKIDALKLDLRLTLLRDSKICKKRDLIGRWLAACLESNSGPFFSFDPSLWSQDIALWSSQALIYCFVEALNKKDISVEKKYLPTTNKRKFIEENHDFSCSMLTEIETPLQ